MRGSVVSVHKPIHAKFVRRALKYGESKDPAKMAYSRMALIRRGPGAKPASSNSHARAGKLQLSMRDTCCSLEQSL